MNKPLRKAKLQGSDVLQLLTQEADRLEPRAARAMRDAFEAIRGRGDATQIAQMVERGQFSQIERLYGSDMTSSEFAAFRRVVGNAAMAGAKISADEQGTVVGIREDFRIEVGVTNPKLANFAENLTSTRIREIDNSVRGTIRGVVRDGSVAGDDPFAIARRIRTSIGLTRRQEAAVNAYRRNLESLDPYALQRALRDKRSDAGIRRAITDAKPLSRERVENLVDRYRARWINYRSQVIGRTETVRAVQGAQWELFQQMIDDGRIDERQVLRTWFVTADDKLRDAHAAIPLMNPDGVGQNEKFKSPLGDILYPADPDAVAANVIQCRCAVFAEIVSAELLGLRDPPRSQAEQSPPPASVQELVTPPTDAGRAQALPNGFLLDDQPIPKGIAATEAFIRDRGISTRTQLKGLPARAAGVMAHEMDLIRQRFDVQPLAFVGPASRLLPRAKPRGAVAAVYPTVRDLSTGDRGGYHMSTTYGSDRDLDRSVEVAKDVRKLSQARKRRDQLAGLEKPTVTQAVQSRAAQMNDDGINYAFTVDYENPAATTRDGQLRSTVAHEFGHVIHLVDKDRIGGEIDTFLRANPRVFDEGWHLLLSEYSRSNTRELVAESFAVYIREPSRNHYRIHPALLDIFRKYDRSFVQ